MPRHLLEVISLKVGCMELQPFDLKINIMEKYKKIKYYF